MSISLDDGLINLGHSVMALVCLGMYSDLCKAINSSWKKTNKKWEEDTQCWSKSYYSVVYFGDCGSGSALSTSISFSIEGILAGMGEWQSKLCLIDCSQKVNLFSYKSSFFFLQSNRTVQTGCRWVKTLFKDVVLDSTSNVYHFNLLIW